MGARCLGRFESGPPNLSTKPLWVSLDLQFGVHVNSVRLGAVGFGTGIRFGAARFGAVGFVAVQCGAVEAVCLVRFGSMRLGSGGVYRFNPTLY